MVFCVLGIACLYHYVFCDNKRIWNLKSEIWKPISLKISCVFVMFFMRIDYTRMLHGELWYELCYFCGTPGILKWVCKWIKMLCYMHLPVWKGNYMASQSVFWLPSATMGLCWYQWVSMSCSVKITVGWFDWWGWTDSSFHGWIQWQAHCGYRFSLIRKSHNLPVPIPTMLNSEQMCAHFCFEWSIVGYGTGTFWDLWN